MFTFSSMQHINKATLLMFRMSFSYAKLACSLSAAKLGLTHVKHIPQVEVKTSDLCHQTIVPLSVLSETAQLRQDL